jgi:hypothetical protein
LDSFENQDKKNFSRNGLGLAISYNMAQLLDGELKAENSPGGWVVFTLTLPALSPDNQKEKRITSEYIPEKIYTIPGYTFEDCISLESVNIPNTVTRIGERAFWGCKKNIRTCSLL